MVSVKKTLNPPRILGAEANACASGYRVGDLLNYAARPRLRSHHITGSVAACCESGCLLFQLNPGVLLAPRPGLLVGAAGCAC